MSSKINISQTIDLKLEQKCKVGLKYKIKNDHVIKTDIDSFRCQSSDN